jgi:hypothetical protein
VRSAASSPTGPREAYQTIGVSGGPASTGVGSSSQPALATTVAAVVPTASAAVTVEIASAIGTTSLRALRFGVRTQQS